MNKTQVKEFRTQFELLAKDLEKKTGTKIDLGKLTFSKDGYCTGKLTASLKSAGGQFHTPESTDLKAHLGFIGIDFGILEQVANYQGKQLKLIGYKRANRKYPFIMKDVNDGTEYKSSLSQIKSIFNYEMVTA